MYYVYVLVAKDGDCYTGFSSDLKKRLLSHNQNENKSTKGKKWKLAYYEAYHSKMDALDRERKLKMRGQAQRFLKQRIHRSVDELITNVC